MAETGVLVLGGYGAFGTRLLRLLSSGPGPVLHVAGRRQDAAERAARALGDRARAVALDRDRPQEVAEYVRAGRIAVVVDAAGPWQGRDYRLPEAVAAVGAHSLDLADARGYVTGIGALDAHARARGVLVASGASTVPAFSVAVVDRLLEDLDALESISVGIAPGHRSPRGLATVRSILSYCGRPIPGVADGRPAPRRGWGGLTRYRYPAPVGKRWLSDVDLPDVEVLAARYPGIDALELKAGLELGVLHLGLSFLSALVARGALRGLEPASAAFKRIADLMHPFGSDRGAMHVEIRGGLGGRRVIRRWALVAERDDGPFVPATAASVLVKRLCGVRGYAPLAVRGATPCVGLVAYDEFVRELAGKAIRIVQRDEALVD
jgi:hypothetical protein